MRKDPVESLKLTVLDTAGVGVRRPVTGGVPVAEAAAPPDRIFVLRNSKGQPVPLQSAVLARWKDGSSRWVLLDFQAAPPAGGRESYVLSWEAEGAGAPEIPCRVDRDASVLRTGELSVSPSETGVLDLSGRFDVVLSLTDEGGQTCEAVVESVDIETAGDLRATLSLVGAFRNPAGDRLFQFRLRASIFAGRSVIRLEPMVLVDAEREIVQQIRELRLSLTPRGSAGSARLGGAPGWEGAADGAVRLFQYDDRNYRLEGAEGEGGKAPGWAELSGGQATIAMALRAFWQQWPKSLETSPTGLSVGLFPAFTEGDYAHMEPWYKHQYLFGDRVYRLRTGQARRWDVWVDLNGNGEALARLANAPSVPVADPAQAIATGVWDAIAPAAAEGLAEYNAWAENLFDAYVRSIEVQRDYGEMNWGDWFGERQVNWGNHEYDTTNQVLTQYARTGDPKYLYVADAAARHSSEVDTIHFVNADLAAYFNEHWPRPDYPPRAGMVHQHAVGHVGGFYPVERIRELFREVSVDKRERPYLCLDPANLGHIWTQGLVRHYFLTGDPFVKETVERIGQNLSQLVEDRKYRFMGSTHCGRTTGWPLLALGGAYEVSFDERYLNAMRTLADEALAEQDPVCGGWLIHPMAPDHCVCQTVRHTGMAGFITAVLINGLSCYHRLSGDGRLPQAIERAVTFLDNDTWREEWKDWRYTSCPATRATGQPGVVVMAHVNSIRVSDNPEHIRILKVAWDAKFRRLLRAPEPGPGQGKTYTSKMYGCAEAVGLLLGRANGST